MMLNDELLSDYCEKFFGFGRWAAPIWFVGIEEAGGGDEAEVERRLKTWAERGCHELEDAPTFYPATGNHTWHGPDAQAQPTWQQLIRIVLRVRGKPDTDEAILQYQRRFLAADTGETCIIELLPLPSPRTSLWHYSRWCRLSWLQSRSLYLNAMREKRANALARQIRFLLPQLVIFYGTTLPGPMSLLPVWSRIAGGNFQQAAPNRKILLQRQAPETYFFVTKHPAAEDLRPNADDYFREVADLVRAKCGEVISGAGS